MRCQLKHLKLFVLVGIMIVSIFKSEAQTFEAQNCDNLYVSLSWSPDGGSYRLLRMFTSQTEWDTLTITSETSYNDTIFRTLCNDTIHYKLLSSTNAIYPERKVPFTDALPTNPPTLDVCTVDPITQKITLKWHPSPDPDIRGYFICSRDQESQPCMALDTLWSATDTQYTSAHSISDPHYYRIYAFDSCFTASPFTESFCNMALSVEGQPCGTTLHASWNAYKGMELRNYNLQTVSYNRAGRTNISHSDIQDLSYDIVVPDDALRLEIWVEAIGRDGRVARSNMVNYNFQTADTIQYLEILSANVQEDSKSIALTFRADPTFPANYYSLYRSANGMPFQEIARLPFLNESEFSYTDKSCSPSQTRYSYRLGVLDGCGRNEKYSNTATSILLTLETTEEGKDGISNELRWTSYANSSSVTHDYNLQRKVGTTGIWQTIATTSETFYKDRIENPSEILYYRVNCLNANSNIVICTVPTKVWIPNAFTPSLETNNQLCLSAHGVREYTFTIYNRQGLLVFQSETPSECWDGNGPNNIPAPEGSYVYQLTYKDNHGSTQIQNGTILLIR